MAQGEPVLKAVEAALEKRRLEAGTERERLLGRTRLQRKGRAG